MKIQEIVDYYYNSDINCLKVSFRLNIDQMNQIRETECDIDDIRQWEYAIVFNPSLISESTHLYFEDENEDYFF